MVYNRFSFWVTLRVLLLFVTLATWAAIFLRPDLLFNQIILLVLILFQLIGLIRYVSKTNQELSRFLDSVRDADHTARFSISTMDPSFKKLNRSFGDLISILGESETEKNAQGLFLSALIEEIPFGLLVMETSGDLRFINHQAQSILDVPNVKSWTHLKSKRTNLLAEINKEASNRPFIISEDQQQYTVSVSAVKIREEELKIVSIKNIQTELQKNETEAWHKLIRVLTHEIMNSVTPIASITQTLKSMLADKKSLDQETLEDTKEAVETIYARSDGIIDFVKRYRQLSRIPDPNFHLRDLLDIIKRIKVLMSSQYPELTINIEIASSIKKVEINCDESQIEQVLINLIKNAREAYQELKLQDPSIQCTLLQDAHDWVLNVSDHGSGITNSQLNQIFVPFYTTKRDGSGIGLGLSRQIIQNHHGSLTCESQSQPTMFSVRLPNPFAS